jgi:predicted GNAT superfamily acetyltransferase
VAARAHVEIRPVTTLEGADAVLEILRRTWGPEPALPRELVRAFQASGTPPVGAFHEGRLVGYVLGFLGTGEEGVHLHSHMLAVLPEHRSAGVGHALKLAQRAAALDAGIRIVRWTFDPLIARNAHFNLMKLGAVADRFHRHLYGDMGDELNRDDRSDRLEVRWALDRDPERGSSGDVREAVVVLGREGDLDTPKPVDANVPGDLAVVEIPSNYERLRDRDRALAAEWREATAWALEACFSAGLVATRFLRPAGYLFARPTP